MDIQQLFQDIINRPIPSLLVVANLIIIESLLSVDNAAVLATMVMDLTPRQRKKALKYGIFGAYFFRGLALLFAAFLVKFWYLKPLGGLYLLYLFIDWLKKKYSEDEENSKEVAKDESWLYKRTVGVVGNFWATIILVEIMDVAFSIDNVFGAVAFSNNILLIWLGVFIGILAMRFVAQIFVSLMEKYPFLESCAFVVIGLLGIKLILSTLEHFYPNAPISELLSSNKADYITSLITVCIFGLPFVLRALFYRKDKNKKLG
jgi:YkoY family integral membrane protein